MTMGQDSNEILILEYLTLEVVMIAHTEVLDIDLEGKDSSMSPMFALQGSVHGSAS